MRTFVSVMMWIIVNNLPFYVIFLECLLKRFAKILVWLLPSNYFSN